MIACIDGYRFPPGLGRKYADQQEPLQMRELSNGDDPEVAGFVTAIMPDPGLGFRQVFATVRHARSFSTEADRRGREHL
jgi:hypothetical protein